MFALLSLYPIYYQLLDFDSGIRKTFTVVFLQMGVERGSFSKWQFSQVDFLIQVQYETPAESINKPSY